MNTQTHSITTWVQLAQALLQAAEWSDPRTAEPVGSVTFERLGGNVVHMTMSLDLVPMGVATATVEEF